MKPVCLLLALLICSPAAGLAQVPPAPPAAPVAPAPSPSPVPPAPPAVPVPPAEMAVPAPPVPPAPPAPFVHVAPLVEVAIPDVDVQMALDMAHDAIRDIDFHAIAESARRAGEEAMQNVDVEAIKEQAERIKEEFEFQSELFKEQAKEMAKQSWDLQRVNEFNFQNDFNFENAGSMFQGRGPVNVFGPGSRNESGQYSNAVRMVERRQYEQALVRLDQVAAMKGPHADGSLYWKAYAQYKLGRTEDAMATIAQLRQSYAQSRYLNDVRVLEADARQSSGRPLTGAADDDDIKLLAINAMQNSNPEGAIPLLEGVLTKTNGLSVKKRALFVLANNEQPAAHQLLLRYAKGAGNPDLQLEAVRYLGARRQKTSAAELEDIYNSTQDVDVRRAVLDALISSRDRVTLLKIAGSDAPVDLRRRALNGLGNDSLMTPQEFFQLYQKETDKELRRSMVSALGSMGAADQLSQIIRTEKEVDVRNQAIRSLGNIRNERTGQMLVELYSANEDAASRKAVAAALANQDNAQALVEIARKETNNELRIELVKRITDLASKNKIAMDYLMELIK